MKQSYEQQLLDNWEDVFRQGLLTFWVFVALRTQELDVPTLKTRIEELTKGTYLVAEQTLYRVLRKHYDLELVDMRKVPSSNGPDRKLYTLSRLGQTLLQDFASRNISLFAQGEVAQIIKKGVK
jgi:DNA-binding PadR family transcriptional regulator